MDTGQIRAVITGLVRGMDGVDAGQMPATASLEDLGIDSMSMMDLLAKVEREFGIEVPDEQLPVIVSIEDLVDFVASAKEEVSR